MTTTTPDSRPLPTTSPAGAGVVMACASMLSVQVGLAVSVGLIGTLGPEGAAWLRLTLAGLLLLAIGRPWRARWTRESLVAAVLLGAVTAGVTMLFMQAVARLPLGTASAVEFLGPLSVAVLRGRGSGRWVWPGLAGAGVLLLTEPWRGAVDPVGVAFALAAAACWASYILLTQRIGDQVEGVAGLGVSMPVAALVAGLVAGPATWPLMTPQLWLVGLGLALLLPVVPFTLELLALRRLTTAAFGTLMSLEPAFALLVGLVLLGQVPSAVAVLGIALVVVAGAGAARAGSRRPAQVVPEHEPEPTPAR